MNLFRKALSFWLSDGRASERVLLSGGGASEAGEIVSERSALATSSGWACVNLLAGTISTLPLVLARTLPDGSREAFTGHRLYEILHDSPNADQTASDYWEFSQAAIELQGNSYSRKLRNGAGVIIGLEPITPAAMARPKRRPDGRIEYRWTANGRSLVGTEEDILHIRGFGGDPLGGLSTLEYARNTLGLALAIDRAASATFKNGIRPAGFLIFDKFLSKENRAVAESDLVTKFTGAMNAGRPMVLEGGTKWQSLTMNPEDAQMLQSRGFSVEEVCRFFGVPPFMIGHTEKTTSWGSGLEQQILAFQKFTLRRRLKRIEQALMKQLLTPVERAHGITIEFNLEGLLRGDSAARAAFYQSGLTNGWLTINEVRRRENLAPVDGGNVPRMQSQNVPITDAGKTTGGNP